jgi:hypothetical protein
LVSKIIFKTHLSSWKVNYYEKSSKKDTKLKMKIIHSRAKKNSKMTQTITARDRGKKAFTQLQQRRDQLLQHCNISIFHFQAPAQVFLIVKHLAVFQPTIHSSLRINHATPRQSDKM